MSALLKYKMYYAFGKEFKIVVIIFWSSEIIDGMLFTFENKSSTYALGVISGVASLITIDEQLQ